MDKFTLKALLSAQDSLTPVLKNVQTAAAGARKYLGDMGGAIGNFSSKVGLPIAALGTIAAGFSAMAIKNAVVNFTELAGAVRDGAVRAGMTTDEFQRLKFVAEQAGVEMGAMEGAAGRLNKSLGDARMGKNDSLLGLMQALKIPLRDANGQMRSAVSLLPEIAEAFRVNDDPVRRAAIGTALFGKSYQELLPLLVDGKQGINDSLSAFAKFKSVIPPEELDRADALGDKFQLLPALLGSFAQTIARQVLPVVDSMVDGFLDWGSGLRKDANDPVKKFGEDIATALKEIDWKAFLVGVRNFIAGIGNAVDMVGGFKNALIALAVVMNAQTILAIGSMVAALARMGWMAGVVVYSRIGLLATANAALGASFLWMRAQAVAAILALRIGGIAVLWSGLAGAVLAAGAAIAAAGGYLLAAGRAVLLFSRAALLSPLGILVAVAGAAYLIYRNWDGIAAFFGRIGEGIGQAWAGVATAISGRWSEITAAVAEKWGQLGELVTSGLALVQGLLASWSPLQWVHAAWEPITGFLGGTWGQLSGLVTGGLALVQGLLSSWSPLQWVRAAWEPIVSYFGGIWDKVAGFIRPIASAAAWVGDKLGSAASGIARAAAPMVEALPTAPSAGNAAAPGALGSGTASLVQPAQASLTGKVDISFKNAPPGMQVEQARTSAPRVAVNTNVGFRSLATDTGF